MGKVEAQLVATEERCRELEKLLAEERAKGAMSEVAHLQAVVKWCVSVKCCIDCLGLLFVNCSHSYERIEISCKTQVRLIIKCSLNLIPTHYTCHWQYVTQTPHYQLTYPVSVNAEREAAEMRTEMAEMRAEMASIAAEMASGA